MIVSPKVAETVYRPDGEVIVAFLKDRSFVRGIRGPVGSGKSVGCACELIRIAAEQKPNPQGVRRTRFAVIRNTQPELKTTTIKTWLDWFPEHIWGKFNWQPPFTHNIRIGDIEAEVIFLALDSDEDVKKLYSLELTAAWINEARFVPKGILDVLTSRVGRFPSMRDGGPSWYGIVMDTNAMDPDHWWPIMAGDVPIPDDMLPEDALTLQKPESWRFFNQPGALLEMLDEQGRTIGWDPNPKAENARNLPPDYYRTQIQGKPASIIRRDICNKLVMVKEGAAVFPTFSEDTHIARQPLPILPGQTVFIGQDFGLTPAAVLFQVLRGVKMFQRELVSFNMGAKNFAKELKRLLARDYPNCPVMAYGDPAGDQRAQTDETTPFQIFAAEGIPIYPAPTNDFIRRKETVELCLNTMLDGRPTVLLDPGLRHLKKAMLGGYHYPVIRQPGGGTRYADRPAKNDSSHVADAMQYGLLGCGEGVQGLLVSTARRRGSVTAKSTRRPLERLTR
jgi:hypothetical protein